MFHLYLHKILFDSQLWYYYIVLQNMKNDPIYRNWLIHPNQIHKQYYSIFAGSYSVIVPWVGILFTPHSAIRNPQFSANRVMAKCSAVGFYWELDCRKPSRLPLGHFARHSAHTHGHHVWNRNQRHLCSNHR